jgi:hypothetical protein
MPDFGLESTIRQVLEGRPNGQALLYEHGYDVGEGFVDVLSQYQSLREAAWAGRIRNVDSLIDSLNRASAGPGATG